MTSDHLLRLTEESLIGFKKQEVTSTLFLDAEAMFDRCWHNGLRYKFSEIFSLPPKIVKLLSSFLTNRTLTVFIDKIRLD